MSAAERTAGRASIPMTGAVGDRHPEAGPATLDVSSLPTFAFSHHSLMWWGTMGIMLIEGTVFALAVMAYFYIWTIERTWPPDVLPPDLFWGTANLVVMLLSGIPNHLTKKAGERLDLHGVRVGLLVCIAFGLVFIGLRVMEYRALNVSWDTNAYGSAVWMLLSLHTTHIVTDAYDSVVLAAVMFSDKVEGKRFSDVSDNGMYWYFVIGAWVPIYAVLYLAPRVLS